MAENLEKKKTIENWNESGVVPSSIVFYGPSNYSYVLFLEVVSKYNGIEEKNPLYISVSTYVERNT